MLKRWIDLARRWLKLPAGDPHPPAGDPNSVQVWNPGEGYLKYRKVGYWIGALPMVAVCAGLSAGAIGLPALILAEGKTPGFVGPLVGVIMLGVAALVFFLIAFNWASMHLELEMLRYLLTDRAIRLRRGVSTVEEVTLSYANIQNVKYAQGPLQRVFGIADLIVETAGGGGSVDAAQQGAALHHQGLIKGISQPEKLRELILERVRAAKGGGLGDASDDAQAEAHAQAGAIDTPQGHALLREIRDGLASIHR